MNNIVLISVIVTVGFLIFSSCNKDKSHLKNAEADIIAKERWALDKWKLGDTSGFIELAADEMTYFDPYLEKRITGKEAFKANMEKANGTFSIPGYEIIDPKVQLHGTTGVLTFNLNNYSASGDTTSRWNSTEVYAFMNKDWKLISSHWSLVKP